jgi:Domain of unknown function (DUF1942)
MFASPGVQGLVTPAIPFFNARADNGQNYRALFQAPAPEGISGTPLPQGTVDGQDLL